VHLCGRSFRGDNSSQLLSRIPVFRRFRPSLVPDHPFVNPLLPPPPIDFETLADIAASFVV